MSKYVPVKNFSDRTPNNKLIDAEDIGILAVKAEAAAFPENEAKKIKELEAEIAKEKARKFPCSDYIARCEKKILEIRQSVALYNLQKQKMPKR